MLESDTLERLTSDLRSLPARKRHAILESLSISERARVAALLRPPPSRPKKKAAPAAAPEPFSPWLEERLAEAQAGTPHANGAWRLTSATRQLLAQSARGLADPAASPAPRIQADRRSLAGALGGLLWPRRPL